MNNVPQELIDEAAKRGIVPGVKIRCAYDIKDEDIVPETGRWFQRGRQILFTGRKDQILIRRADGETWATVITPAPAKEEGGLKEGDACECGPAMRDAIAELAKELGIWHHNGVSQKEPSDTIGMWYVRGERMVFWVSRIWPKTKVHTPEAFMAKMRITAKNPKPIMIGDHTVEFRSGSIEVGCTTVDNATVRAITEKLID